MEDMLSPNWPDTDYLVACLHSGRIRLERGGAERPYQSLASKTRSGSRSSVDALREARHRKDEWDKQIEEDARSGKLDQVMEEARKDHRSEGRAPLP